MISKKCFTADYLREEGIRREFQPEKEPSVASALVDLLVENRRLGLMDEGERREMTRNLLTTKRLGIAGLLARLGDHKRSLEDLVGAAIKPIIAEK